MTSPYGGQPSQSHGELGDWLAQKHAERGGGQPWPQQTQAPAAGGWPPQPPQLAQQVYRQPPTYGPPPQGGYYPPAYGSPPQGAYYPPARPAPRKRRRVFMWVFLAIQALFVIWLIAGIASAHSSIPSYCHQASHSAYIGVKGCTSASEAGAAIGVGVVILFWAVVDIILGTSYGVYRLATRDRYR